METGKQGFVGAPAPGSSVSARREDMMHGAQTPLSAVYFHAMGGLPVYAHAQPPADQDTVAFPVSAPQLGSKPTLSLLTLHVASGVPLQQSGQRLGVVTTAARPKSAGKHLCPYCKRDCLKPSVLEKHLRCHTGERPYPCLTCGVAFKTQSNLYKHKRTQAHARLSSDSERDSLSSQESVQGSRETSWSVSSLEGHSEGLDSFEKDVVSPQTPPSITPGLPQVSLTQGKTGPDTGWALQQAAFVGLILASHSCMGGNQEPLNSLGQNNELPSSTVLTQDKKEEGERPSALTPNRHLPLQRQEATLFSRASKGKSQNHDSTDSGFSEGSEQHWTSSPGSALHDHSMESLAESSTEEQEEPPVQAEIGDTRSSSGNTKGRVSLLEKRKLEERISRLISENDALVDDKQLENVRPRKTMPSKQGSIDLPMPYTYKDSFHFEMKTSRQTTTDSDWHKSKRQVKQALYNSVPTQRSASLEHAPLARSSSLPFNIGNSGFERASLSGSYHSQSAQQIGRDNTGHYSGDLLMRSVDQPISHHRSLVRQKAVDCLSSTESLSISSSTEEGYPSSLGTDGESTDAAGDLGSGGKYRRKKTQKFPYNKWYMYGDGTFRKLYSTEKNSDRSILKAKKPAISTEQAKGQETQNKTTVTFKEPGSSRMSTSDVKSTAGVIDSGGRPPKLLPHLPPSGRTNATQDCAFLVASGTCLQKPGMKDLGVPTQQCMLKQSSSQMSDSKKDRGGNETNQEQQSLQHPPSKGLHHLPSERKKQRTDESVEVSTEKTDRGKGHNVLTHAFGYAEDNSMASQNQLLPGIKGHSSQMFTKSIEQSRADRLAAERMDFNVCSIDHHLNQKNVRVTEYPPPPKEVDNKQPTSNINFLPKYQLKLPQSADSGRLASGLAAGTAERNSLSTTAGAEEKQSSTPASASAERCSPVLPAISTPASSGAHATKPSSNSTDTYTNALIPNSAERHTGASSATATPASTLTRKHLEMLTSVSADVPIATATTMAKPMILAAGVHTDTIPSSSKSHCDTYLPRVTLIPRDPPTAVTFSCINPSVCFPGESSVSSHLLPYKGKLTLLNGSTHATAGDTSLFSEQRADLQVCLQIVSGDQLSAVEDQQEPKQEVSSGQDVSREEAKITEGGTITQKPEDGHNMHLPISAAQKNISSEVISSDSGKILTSPVHSISSSWRTGVELSQTKQPGQNARPSLRSAVPLKPIAIPVLHCSKPATQITSTEEVQNKVPPPHCSAEGSNLSPSHKKERQSVRPHLLHNPKLSCHPSHQQTFKGNDVNRSSGNPCSYMTAPGQQHQLTSLAPVPQNPPDNVAVLPIPADAEQSKHKIFLTCDLKYPSHPRFSHHWNSVGCPIGNVASSPPPRNQSHSAKPASKERAEKSRRTGGADVLLSLQMLPDSAPCCTDHTISAPDPAAPAVSPYHTRPWLCKETHVLQKKHLESQTQIRTGPGAVTDTDQSRLSSMELSALVKPDFELENHISTNPLSATLEISQHATSRPESNNQNITGAERGGTVRDVQEMSVEASSQGSAKPHEGVCPAMLPNQQKLSLVGDDSLRLSSSGEIMSESVLVQHKPLHQSESSGVVKLQTECGNSVSEAFESSPMGQACSARGCEISTNNSVRQDKEVPLFPLSHASLSKSTLLPNSDPTMGISAPGRPQSTGVTLLTSDVLCQEIPKPFGSAPAFAGSRLLMRSPVMVTGDGSQDQCTGSQGQLQSSPQDMQVAGQGEKLLSCYPSASFCMQGKRPDDGTTVSDVKDETGDPSTGHLQGGSLSHSAPQGEPGAQCHSEGERSTRGKEGQDVLGAEEPKVAEKSQSDEFNESQSRSSQHSNANETAVPSVLQMPIQLKTTLMHTVQPPAPSETPGPQSRELPIQKETMLRRTMTEDPVLSASALLGSCQEPLQTDIPGTRDTSCKSTQSSEHNEPVLSTHCIIPSGTSARGLSRVGKTPVRAGQNIPEDSVDSSSSDDEGKLVIELE